jgi:hypothetical protein
MSARKLMPIVAIVLISIICLFLLNVKAEDVSGKKFAATRLQQALKAISDKFGVLIIADPLLEGDVSGDIQGDSVEAALKTFLEPLGYSYTEIENYYLICGPKSPLTIMAETESALIPVGFLDPAAREQLSELQQYLHYDESAGVVYIKAPSSRMETILSKLWQITKTSGQLSVVYNLQIIDLGNSSDLDFLFSAAYDGSLPDKNEITLTPEQWSQDGRAQIILKQKAASYSENTARQPWMITLPGKTVQLRSSIRSISSELDTDRYFNIQITPLRVDEFSGGVTSDVNIERNMTTEANLTQDSKVKQINEQGHRAATVLRNIPGQREVLAAVRQTKEIQVKRLWWFGKRTIREHRDFIVLISATPVNIQSTLATSFGLVPIASLSGFEQWIDEQDSVIEHKPILEFGITGTKDDKSVNGWLKFMAPIGQLNSLTLDYRSDDQYSAELSFGLDSETSFKFLAGKGVGPNDQDAAMFGIGDMTRPARYLSLFAEYYPWSYLLDSEDFSKDDVWSAGARLGTENFGATLSGTGDPDYEGWLFRLDYTVKKSTWLMEIDHTREDKPTLSLGFGFQF